MLVLVVPTERIDADRPLAERQLEDSPNGWTGLGRVGLQLRYSGDRRGLDLLVQAADTRLARSKDSHPTALMAPANLLRLAGRHERATELYEKMYRGIQDIGPALSSQERALLVEASFFVGRDQEAVDTSAALQGRRPRAAPGKGLRHPAVADLAAARIAADPARCQPAVDYFDAAITRTRRTSSPFSIGDPSYYDWLEVALLLQSELSGKTSPRLRTI